jgi:stage V sporulation protein B
MANISLMKNTLLMSSSSFIFVITAYLTNIWLGRHLGPESYGVYGVIINLMTAINLTQNSGLPQSVAKYIAEDDSNESTILKSGLILQLVSTVVSTVGLFLLAAPIASILKDSNLVPYIQLSALILPFYGIYALYLNYYNGLHNFKKQTILGIIYAVSKMILIITAVYIFDVYGAILGFIFAPIIALLYGFKWPNRNVKYFSFKKLIIFSLPLIGLAIFTNLMQSIDLIFVKGLLHSDLFTGYYNASQNISKIPFYCIIALASVIYPSISKSISQKLERETKHLITNSIRISILILLPLVLIISATSNQLVILLYSSVYEPASLSLSILVIGIGFITLFTILSTIISSSGNPHLSFLFSFIGVLLVCIFCYLFIPSFGIVGASIATTLSSFIMMLVSAITIYYKFKVFYPFKSLIKILISSIIIFTLAKLILLPIYLLPIVYIVLAFIYFYLLLVFKEINNSEVQHILNYLPKKKA